MAELKLIKIRDIPNVAYIKKYEYGELKLRVTINPDETYFIEAEDKVGALEITSANEFEAMLTAPMLAVMHNEMDEFMIKITQAKELMGIIENRKDELLRKE